MLRYKAIKSHSIHSDGMMAKGEDRDFNMPTAIDDRNGLSPTESNPKITAMLRNTLEPTF